MNALQIIEQVRAHDADVFVEEDRLLVRGRGGDLPTDLKQALQDHKAELMVVLGSPVHISVESILAELRPNLTPSLRVLPDHKLLVLVNAAIIAAWSKTLRQVKLDGS
jgi:hypothetical protein